jgi:hypothetical protein
MTTKTAEEMAAIRGKWNAEGPPLRSIKGFWDPKADEATRALPVRHFTPEECAAYVPAKPKNIDWAEWAEHTAAEQATGYDHRDGTQNRADAVRPRKLEGFDY